MRTLRCGEGVRQGRLRKARTFLEAGESMPDALSADAAVALFVHAGIAAADVLCCAGLGEHARGESHADAVALLARVSQRHAKDLRLLLSLKSPAAYSDRSATLEDLKRAARAATRLVEAAARAR
jgi:hypothetical protein